MMSRSWIGSGQGMGVIILALVMQCQNWTPALDGCNCPGSLRGDLNNDGQINSSDLLLLSQELSGTVVAGQAGIPVAACADLDLDCDVDVADLMIMMRFLSNPVSGSHAGRFIAYEGSKTCRSCHEQEVLEVHGSVHYQWNGPTPAITGQENGRSGKLGSINDFCTYPDFSWLSKMTNVDGVQVDGGCARCHAGMGLKPAPETTTAQLENIDCLVCHSDQYKRKVDLRDGVFKLVPDKSKMKMSLLEAASNIKMPGRDACLNCHSRSGGGNNFKRGDLEEAHRQPARSFDVHMAAKADGGAGLVCIDCHQMSNHRIAGRGVDLRETENTPAPACSNCHTKSPHTLARLNNHTARVDCTVCHIPNFANVAPTDIRRDFSRAGELDAATRLYEPSMMKAAHVIPEYGFWNGKSSFYNFGTPAVAGPNGRVPLVTPEGNINTTGAKIHAFKYHTAVMPVEPARNRIIPLKMGILFQTGNANQAIITGANDIGWGYQGHSFVETERYMGIFHEVAPSEDALVCADCHGGSRIDFSALGYTPRTSRNGQPLCVSCHEDKSNEWPASSFFTNVHKKHVDDKRYDCSNCHTFSKAAS